MILKDCKQGFYLNYNIFEVWQSEDGTWYVDVYSPHSTIIDGELKTIYEFSEELPLLKLDIEVKRVNVVNQGDYLELGDTICQK